ncbi:MAG: hypothetical protein J6M30_08430 [Bacteroidales bacterium]|nr:hypothetical protein [Bacteroidales bacterium]
MGVLAALTLGLTSCGKKDCNCYVEVDGEKVQELFTKDNPTVTDFDGDCDEVKTSDLSAEWRNIGELFDDFKLVCEKD